MSTEDLAGVIWESPLVFQQICPSEELPLQEETGSSGMYYIGDTQIAVFRFPDNKLFASQNMCGHRRAFVLNEGILHHNKDGDAVVSCPIHRRQFALEGKNSGRTQSKFFRHSIATFEVKEENGYIWVALPDTKELDEVLSTQKWSRASTPGRSNTLALGGGGRGRPPIFARDDASKPSPCALDPQLSW